MLSYLKAGGPLVIVVGNKGRTQGMIISGC